MMMHLNAKADEKLFAAAEDMLRTRLLKYADPAAVDVAISRIGAVAAAFAGGGLGDDSLEWRIAKQKSKLGDWAKAVKEAVACRQALLDADALLVTLVTPTLVPLDGRMVSVSIDSYARAALALARDIEQLANVPDAPPGNKPDFEVRALVQSTAQLYWDCAGELPDYKACAGGYATFFSEVLYKLVHSCSPDQAERVTPYRVYSAIKRLVDDQPTEENNLG
jgi:hypothetical protein